MAPCVSMEPFHDLNLLQKLIRYKEFNPKLSDAALHKLTKHLWYLSEKLAPLGLFDNTVSNEMKLKMIDAFKNCESFVKRKVRAEVDLRHALTYDIIFDQFNLSYDFLDKNHEQWEEEENDKSALMVFKELKVVNDIAERAVALIEEYNQCLTKDQQQQEYLLRIVAKYRKDYPDCNKKTLSTN
ncbi:uncharacterized protein [Prorops nasuta]|uniref:uncharacterized protein n=1 Tax=Prorops nasuta TaxID=863751 RepID=UPI0034CFC8C9